MSTTYAHLPMNFPRPPMPDVSTARIRTMLALSEQPDVPAFELQMAIARAWGAGYIKPHQQLSRARWVELFRRAGYFTLASVPAPVEPVRLYRGAADGHERGMSWTTSPHIARQFDFTLWTVLAPPTAILATFSMLHEDEDGNDLAEYILDLPNDVAVEETSAPGHGGHVLDFPGKTTEAVARHVRRFLVDEGLDTLRPSALGWRVLHPRRKHSLAAVEFTGYAAVLNEARQRHRTWLAWTFPNIRHTKEQ